MRSIFMLLASLLVTAQLSYAQNFKLLRYDEDYSGLKDSVSTFYNKLKYLPLSSGGAYYISFGGEIRHEIDRAQNEDWGARNMGSHIFLLQRYQLHADLHLGDRVRVFGQLRSGLENGRKYGPRPIDEDQLNVQNLFVDLVPFKASGRMLTLRLGRQEIQYGSGRLIDVQEGPNLRLYFDGAKIAYSSPKWNVDGFVMAAGRVKTGVFDNPLSRKVGLWGVYSSWVAAKRINIDLLYFGINRENAVFNEGIADELRHTIGTRLWSNSSNFTYNFEMGYQFGKFGHGDISAWGGAADIGYRFSGLIGSPAINFRCDLLSGDGASGDGKLGTLNALYPNAGYFGMNPQAGPANLLSVHPRLAWNPGKSVRLSLEAVCYWRQSLNDGIYRPDGTFSLPSSGSEKRYIGTAYLSAASWNINRFLNYILVAQLFETGAFINDVIPQHKDGFFVGSILAFKF